MRRRHLAHDIRDRRHLHRDLAQQQLGESDDVDDEEERLGQRPADELAEHVAPLPCTLVAAELLRRFLGELDDEMRDRRLGVAQGVEERPPELRKLGNDPPDGLEVVVGLEPGGEESFRRFVRRAAALGEPQLDAQDPDHRVVDATLDFHHRPGGPDEVVDDRLQRLERPVPPAVHEAFDEPREIGGVLQRLDQLDEVGVAEELRLLETSVERLREQLSRVAGDRGPQEHILGVLDEGLVGVAEEALARLLDGLPGLLDARPDDRDRV